MMKQLFFVFFLAAVVLMVFANKENPETDNPDKTGGASMTTLTTASLMGLAFNILMNFRQ